MNPDINGFELDGNAAGTSANDWNALGSPLKFTGFREDPTDGSDFGFGSGQTKDTRDISLWTWEQADVTPAKSDIENDYAAVYAEDGNLILYFGQNRQLDNSGDANVGFWLLQNEIGLNPNGTFSGVHADGDLLVQSEFTNGGVVSGIRVYKWLNGALSEVTEAVGQCAGGKLGILNACAIVNTTTIATNWAGDLTAPFFFEGGVNLTGLFGQSVPCFSTFLTNTRTSQAESADLKDFGLGAIDTCASLKITKQATPSDATQFGYSTTGGLSPATFNLASGQSRTYTKLQPGSYSVVEDVVPAGWALESLTCPVVTGPGTSANVNGATASVTLGFVGHVECTYVNERLPAQVSVNKTPDNQTINAGQPATFTMTATNNGPGVGTITLADNLPLGSGGLTWVESNDPSNSCTVSTQPPQQQTLSCSFTNVPATESRTVSVTTQTDQADCATLNNTATVSSTDDSTPNDNTNSGSITIACPDVSVLKTGNGTITAGQNAQFTMVVTNNGPGAASGVGLTDTLPGSGWTISSQTAGNCVINGGNSLVCTGISLPTQGATYTVVVSRATASPADCGPMPNTATVSMTGDTNAGNNSSSATVTVNCPDIQVVKTGNGPITAGQDAVFDIVITNNGPGTATGVSLTDNVGAGWTITDQTGAACGIAAGVLSCSGIELAQGASYEIEITKTTSNANCGQIENTVTVSAENEGTNQQNNTSSATIVVNCPDITVTKVGNGTVSAGEQAQFTITITNNGPGTATGVSLTDTLPGTGWTIDSQTGAACGIAAGVLTCDGITLAQGASYTIVIVKTTTNADCANLPNTATVAAANEHPDGEAPNSDSDTVVVRCPDITVVKTGNGPISAGEDAVFDIVITNNGPGTATGVSLTDNVGPGWTITDQTGAACGIAAGVLTCSGITLAQGASYEIEITKTTSNEDCGPIENTVTVSAGNEDPNAGGNNEGEATIVVNCPDITVEKTGNGTVDIPGFAVFTMVITNLGPGTATGVGLTDNLPGSGWEIVSQTDDDCVLDQGGDNLTCSGITLSPSGEGSTYSVTVRRATTVEDCGQLPNTAEVSAANENPEGEAPNSDSDTVIVRCPGTIIIKKETLPDGDPADFQFTFEEEGFTLSDGEQEVFGNLDPGTYTVDEDVPAGWDLQSIDCGEADVDQEGSSVEINLHEDETVTCTFLNEKDSRIVVEKQTVPNGDPSEFAFSGSWGGSEGVNFNLSDGEQFDSGELEPGEYAVGEDVPLGWDLTGIDCSTEVGRQGSNVFIDLSPGQVVTCVFTNTKLPPGSINVIKTANPTSIQEPGGNVEYTVTVQNTSTVDVTVTSVVDDRFGSLANVAGGSPSGCFAVPFLLAPGASQTCTFTRALTGTAGQSHINVVTVTGRDTSGNTLTDSDDARVDFTPRLIDLVVVKNATSPTPLNGTVTYTMTVTNKGPDTATNVQLVDPAPAGIRYLTVSPGAPTCTLTPALITCNLGTLAAGQSRTITVTARATLVGRHVNTATVTGEGGRETNPADNTDSAVTVVPKPPVVTPPVAPTVCLTLTVTPKMIKADGRPDRVTVKVTAGPKRVKGAAVRIKGPGIKKTKRSNAKGMVRMRVNPKRPGVLTVTAVETKQQKVCGPKRIGAVGVFLPPLTG